MRATLAFVPGELSPRRAANGAPKARDDGSASGDDDDDDDDDDDNRPRCV